MDTLLLHRPTAMRAARTHHLRVVFFHSSLLLWQWIKRLNEGSRATRAIVLSLVVHENNVGKRAKKSRRAIQE